MFSKLFGTKKKKDETPIHYGPKKPDGYGNWSFIGTDIHSHLIPGIDDGAQTIEDSVVLIQQLHGMGFNQIVTTPHIKSDHFPNNSVNIKAGLHTLQQTLHERNINIPVKAAAEYYIDDHFMNLLEEGDLLTVTDNQVLVELSFMFEPVRLSDILFKIQTKGFRPIMAHPERYAYYHNNIDAYRALKDKGCLLQLNTISLSGYYGKPVKHIAEKLLHEKLYDYCGTDMHHVRHAESMQKLLQSGIMPTLQRYPFLNSKLQLV
jgi:tyrosine-protein phosphatase YwqE